MLNRRDFFKAGVAGLVTAQAHRMASWSGKARLDRIGLQLFTIPTLVERDFAGTMKLLADIGYKEIEMFGPYP